MSNVTISTLGQINNAGVTEALMLKQFSGDVLNSFNNMVQYKGRVRVKDLGPGAKSYQFPAIGTATATRHTAGDDVFLAGAGYLNNIAHAERVILYDRPMVAPVAIDDWEEFINHYDVRGEYATQIGQALAEKLDQDILRVAVLTAREGATITSGPTTTKINIGTSPTAGDLVDMCFDIAQQFDENNVPKDGRIVALDPDLYYTLVKGAPEQLTASAVAIAHPGRAELGDAGNVSVADGYVRKVANVEITTTNLLPTGNETGTVDAGAKNTYYADWTGLRAVAWQRGAVGHIHGRGIAVEQQKELGTMSHNMVASYVAGTGPLRPESAIEIEGV
jgi:hypothetical protein